jgi:hypothetical protein
MSIVVMWGNFVFRIFSCGKHWLVFMFMPVVNCDRDVGTCAADR